MSDQRLKREVGAGGAVLLGLGSMVGAGVFVSVGVAIDIAGPSACLAVALAALLALCNGLSSAQLAAAHPVSGGTYEYGYRQLNAWWGFSAGWLFLCAKSASAATAAIGFAHYAFPGAPTLIPAAATVAVLTAVTLTGLRRSNRVNAVLVSIVMAGLLAFAAVGLYRSGDGGFSLTPFFASPAGDPVTITGFLEAAALMFVAYTGYGRVATLGEEIRDPRRSIPRAIIAVMAVTLALYTLVTIVAAGYGGGSSEAEGGLLSAIARGFGSPALAAALTGAAAVALLGVLLNLILGLSRVMLAMGRRGDIPSVFARVEKSGTTPAPAVLASGLLIAALTLIGDVKAAWSFSAFTVLGYYSVTNLSALRLPPEKRLYPRFISYGGLAGCAFLAFWVEPIYLLIGSGVIGAGFIWKAAANQIQLNKPAETDES